MALQFVPDDALVLRLRPDLAELTPGFVDFLTGVQRGDIKAKTPAAPVYQSTVFINSGFLACSFYINDIILLATKPDLKRIFHFDYGFEFFGSNLAPEQFFYLRAFADKFPLLDAFSRLNTGVVFEKPDVSTRLVRAQLDSDFFMDVLGLYWVLLNIISTLGSSCRRAGIRPGSKAKSASGACSICLQHPSGFLACCTTLAPTRRCAREVIRFTRFLVGNCCAIGILNVWMMRSSMRAEGCTERRLGPRRIRRSSTPTWPPFRP